ncbi:MAG TPA: hypothetical protein VFR02_10050 [bacterium]|nr:hypothetical protein [bacterium]
MRSLPTRRPASLLPLLWAAFAALPLNAATPTATPSTPVTAAGGGARLLEIHKPLIPAAWGRVLQYRKETNISAGGSQETLYEFVLQTEDGVVRTATYHESTDGTGYWEVYVWDEP